MHISTDVRLEVILPVAGAVVVIAALFVALVLCFCAAGQQQNKKGQYPPPECFQDTEEVDPEYSLKPMKWFGGSILTDFNELNCGITLPLHSDTETEPDHSRTTPASNTPIEPDDPNQACPNDDDGSSNETSQVDTSPMDPPYLRDTSAPNMPPAPVAATPHEDSIDVTDLCSSGDECTEPNTSSVTGVGTVVSASQSAGEPHHHHINNEQHDETWQAKVQQTWDQNTFVPHSHEHDKDNEVTESFIARFAHTHIDSGSGLSSDNSAGNYIYNAITHSTED